MDPTALYPRGVGTFTSADHNIRVEFMTNHVDMQRLSGVEGFGGVPRTLRERLPDNSAPGHIRRVNPIEQVALSMPDLATAVRLKMFSEIHEHAEDSPAFTLNSVTVSITFANTRYKEHIDVEYQIVAGGDVLTVRHRDPVT